MISPIIDLHPAISSVFKISTPITFSLPVIEETFSDAICSQPPGAQPKSITDSPGSKKLNLSFICKSLKAALDLYPLFCVSKTYGSLSCRPIHLVLEDFLFLSFFILFNNPLELPNEPELFLLVIMNIFCRFKKTAFCSCMTSRTSLLY